MARNIKSKPKKSGIQTKIAAVSAKKPASEHEVMLAYLQNQQLEGADDYLRRGRELANLSTEELNDRWVAAFKKMAQMVQTGHREDENNRTARTDIESELLIRRIEPPYGLVKYELAILTNAANKALADLQRNPGQWAQAEQELQADLADFQDASKKARQN